MNCCDQTMPNGCNQGRNCPVRQSRVTCEQTFEAARLLDSARLSAAAQVSPTASEVGNVWFTDTDTDTSDGTPVLLRTRDLIVLGLASAVAVGIWCVGLGVVAGFVWTRWLADLFISAASWGLLA